MTSTLVILGEVEHPLELDFATLSRLAPSLPSLPVRLAAGRDVPALRLDALLARAGIAPGARSLVAESEDGARVLSLPLAIVHTCLLIYRVGQLPLPRGLGGPLRLFAPRYGEVKSLATLYVSDAPWVREDDTERVVVAA